MGHGNNNIHTQTDTEINRQNWIGQSLLRCHMFWFALQGFFTWYRKRSIVERNCSIWQDKRISCLQCLRQPSHLISAQARHTISQYQCFGFKQRVPKSVSNVNIVIHRVENVIPHRSDISIPSKQLVIPSAWFSTRRKLNSVLQIFNWGVENHVLKLKFNFAANTPFDSCWKTSWMQWIIMCTFESDLETPVNVATLAKSSKKPCIFHQW